MKIGTQLNVPNGFKSLGRKTRYYFLAYDRVAARVNLVFYSKIKNGYSTRSISIQSKDFEQGLELGLIVIDDIQLTMPPWMYREFNNQYIKDDDWLAYARIKHKDLVDKRLSQIEPLINEIDKIRNSDNPNIFFRKVVNDNPVTLRRTRLKNWFYAYVLHGRSRDALLPEFFLNGVRTGGICQERGIRVGRKSTSLGKHGGSASSKEMSKKIVDAFVKHSKIGRPMTEIYAIAISKTFGCRTETNLETGYEGFYHPKGKPYPTFDQFRYRLKKVIGELAIAERIQGPKKAKRNLKADIGPYTESVGNLMESIEFDGYFVKERPRSLLGDGYLGCLCVIRAIDVVSGMIVGIGFSMDSEVATAYNMCLFSMVMNKVEFCRLFGLEIDGDSWPCQGMPAGEIYDRGPAVKLLKDVVDENMAIGGWTLSFDGGSKAIVEASHPRDMKNDESPSFTVSHLNYIQMVKREIQRVIKDSLGSDASSRMTPNMIEQKVPQFPVAIWRHLESRGRTDAFPMNIEEAVRKYLVETTVMVNRRGVFLHGIRYYSTELSETGVFDKAARGPKLTLTAYVMTACVRNIWVFHDKRLFLVSAKLPINDDEKQLYMPLEEQKELKVKSLKSMASFKTHKLAVESAVRSDFESQVGVSWDAGNVKKGRPIRSPESRAEIIDIKNMGKD